MELHQPIYSLYTCAERGADMSSSCTTVYSESNYAPSYAITIDLCIQIRTLGASENVLRELLTEDDASYQNLKSQTFYSFQSQQVHSSMYFVYLFSFLQPSNQILLFV